jgi:hypothetical protein
MAGGQLLKHIHVTKLQLAALAYLVSHSDKESILVKIVVNNPFSKTRAAHR